MLTLLSQQILELHSSAVQSQVTVVSQEAGTSVFRWNLPFLTIILFYCSLRIASNAGARTPLYGFFVGLFTLLSTYFLLGYLYYLPKAVLACIISLVVYAILAECPEEIAFFVRMRAWSDMALMFLTFALTLLVSVEVSLSDTIG